MKLCNDCKWYTRWSPGGFCHSPRNVRSPIDGKPESADASTARGYYGPRWMGITTCGPDAKYFEQRLNDEELGETPQHRIYRLGRNGGR